MHRHEALRPLSRGHQRVLFHAREMKWRGPDALPAFLDFAREALPRHLDAEERHLLPAMDARLPGGDPAIARTREAHEAIRAEVARVAAEPERIRDLSRLLHDHVRDQERCLFPLAEQVLGEAGLAEVAKGLGGAFSL